MTSKILLAGQHCVGILGSSCSWLIVEQFDIVDALIEPVTTKQGTLET